MPISEARSLVRARDVVVVESNHPEHDRKALMELAVFCERYSPCVGLEEADQPDSLLMDITGVSDLFGGETSLADRMRLELTRRKYTVQIAIADAVGSAWAAAHFPLDPTCPVVIPAGAIEDFGLLPIAALRLGSGEFQKLQRLGIKTIQQLLKISRSSLPARLGSTVGLRLAQLLGERHEIITPCRPQPRFVSMQQLEDGLTHLPSIEQFSLTLLNNLLDKLRQRQTGTRQLACEFVLDDASTNDISLRFCEVTADAPHIAQLFRLKLETIQLKGSVVGVRWEALDVSPLSTEQQTLFMDRPNGTEHEFHVLLDRLSSRLGITAVVRSRLRPNPIPEQAVELVPVTEGMTDLAQQLATRFLPSDRPTALCHPPELIKATALVPNGPPATFLWDGSRYEIENHRGPERVESGWWQGTIVRRDYYWVETTDGRHFWVFQQLSDRQWFLHGEMA